MAKPKFSEEAVYQEINLGELLGFDLSDASELKQYVGQLIIDRIRARTEEGKGYNGKALKSPYSDSYSKGMEFKAIKLLLDGTMIPKTLRHITIIQVIQSLSVHSLA